MKLREIEQEKRRQTVRKHVDMLSDEETDVCPVLHDWVKCIWSYFDAVSEFLFH